MKTNWKAVLVLGITIALFLSPLPAGKPADINLRGFDKFATKVMADWKVPGAAVAVVQGDRVVYARGFGWRNLEKKLPVTPDTLFAIGSCSKAFTAASLGIMADRGQLDWSMPVRDYLPDFQLQDHFASQEMTAVDLMCHRSGLPRHDLSWYNADVPRRELFLRLPHLEPTAPFRVQFQYNNFMFLTAGVLLEKLSGQSWEAFVQQNFFDPLGMQTSNFSVEDSQKSPNFSLPYTEREDKVMAIPFRKIDAMGPAGSINSSVNEMAKWLILNIQQGTWKDRELVKKNTMATIHSPRMIASGSFPQYDETFYTLYGLGWMITDYRGEVVVTHGGGIDGFISDVSFLPRKKTGVVILTNSGSGGGAVCAVLARNICDRVLGQKPVDWNGRLKEQVREAEEAREKQEKKDKWIEGTSPTHDLADYAGDYENPGYGTLKVEVNGKNLVLTFNGIQMTGTHHHYDVFNFTNPEMDVEEMLGVFHYDKAGRVDRLALPLQAGVEDIVFTRMAAEKFRQKEFLQKFTGDYEIQGAIVTVAFKDDQTLKMVVPGQPEYTLDPLSETEFKLAELEGFTVEFVLNDEGKVTAVKSHQPNGSFEMKKVEK